MSQNRDSFLYDKRRVGSQDLDNIVANTYRW